MGEIIRAISNAINTLWIYIFRPRTAINKYGNHCNKKHSLLLAYLCIIEISSIAGSITILVYFQIRLKLVLFGCATVIVAIIIGTIINGLTLLRRDFAKAMFHTSIVEFYILFPCFIFSMVSSLLTCLLLVALSEHYINSYLLYFPLGIGITTLMGIIFGFMQASKLSASKKVGLAETVIVILSLILSFCLVYFIFGQELYYMIAEIVNVFMAVIPYQE